MKRLRTVYRLAGLLLTLSCTPSALAQNIDHLVFHTITPCRIIDTRVPSTPLGSNEARGFNVFGTNLSSQGGSTSGCGLPELAGDGSAQTMAIAVNVIAINPQGSGNLKGWAGDIAEPLRAGVVNYQVLNPNLNIANATILAIRTTGSLGVGEDIVLRANGAATDVVADVAGYFGPAVTGGLFMGKISPPTVCLAGQHSILGAASGLTGSSESCDSCSPTATAQLSPNVACTARNLSVKFLGSTGSSGGARTATLLANGSLTPLTCTAAEPALTCASATSTASISPGSDLTIEYDTNAASGPTCAVEFGFQCN